MGSPNTRIDASTTGPGLVTLAVRVIGPSPLTPNRAVHVPCVALAAPVKTLPPLSISVASAPAALTVAPLTAHAPPLPGSDVGMGDAAGVGDAACVGKVAGAVGVPGVVDGEGSARVDAGTAAICAGANEMAAKIPTPTPIAFFTNDFQRIAVLQGLGRRASVRLDKCSDAPAC
jgi:hypothetical protein